MLSKDYPSHTLYPMPALSPTMTTGTISNWSVSAGSSFSAGDVLCEIETDKASMDFEAQDDGIVAKILREGDSAKDLDVGVPICVVVEDEDDVEAFADFVVEETSSGGGADATESTPSTPTPATETISTNVGGEGSFLSPAARHISQSEGVDATVLKGTGKDGRVTKGDVLIALKDGVLPPLPTTTTSTSIATDATVAAPTPSPTPVAPMEVEIPTITTSGGYEDIPNNNMRKVIARRLTESKATVPHFYSTIEVELDNIMSLRKKLASTHDVKVSVNDFIIKASAMALRDVPEVNSSYSSSSNSVTMSETVDISVAVATPTGLITPIVPETDTLGLSGISSKVKDLATRARDGKLAPEEYQGGSFCISNLGMFGITEFSAVINPPQAAILAVGGGVKTVVPSLYDESKGLDEQEKPSIKTVMTARLSADRRVVDETTAALFLSALRHYLGKPELLIM